ncbi:hypothetical protein, partial [Salmonella sp. SAL4435]|uniref:hypothetical protein n=1 Tax=Salmonella sp. SAL4435 TaxID=3159890 RepID=UPI0039788D90
PTPDTRQSDVSDEEFEEIRQRFREAYTQNQPAVVLPPDIPVGADTIIEALRAAHSALDQCCVMLIENGERTEQERMVLHTVALAA